jgi:hypothetical protein
MRSAFHFLAFAALVYAVFALHTLGFGQPGVRVELERDFEDLNNKANGTGFRALLFRIGRPPYWLVTLPIRSPGMALCLSVLLALPAVFV